MWTPNDGRTPITPDVVDVCVLHRERAPGLVRADAGAGHRWRVLLLERGAATRCPGSWEVVHGRIEPGERPEDAAVREVREETGLEVLRLYCVTVNAFYLAGRDIKTAIVFAAVVGEGGAPPAVTLGPEHVRSRWLTMPVASRSVTWPREREALGHIGHLLRSGDAGVAEDVLRVR
jgi:8-oxo-dGTP pyrophosphatase MutT (NUDIX family)